LWYLLKKIPNILKANTTPTGKERLGETGATKIIDYWHAITYQVFFNTE